MKSLARALPLLITGCVSQLAPSVFQVAPDRANVDVVVRALAVQGTSAQRIDPAGIVETPWESTGENNDGTIWAARYVITIAPAGRVTVAMDLRTCESGLGRNVVTGELDGSSCARLPDGTTPEYYQGNLDRFAASLRTALEDPGITVVAEVAPEPEPPPDGAQRITGALEATDARATGGEFQDSYFFEWQSGQTVHAEVESEFDNYLVLRAPSGAQMENDDRESGNFNAMIDATLQESGRYELIVTSFAAGSVGPYSLVVGAR